MGDRGKARASYESADAERQEAELSEAWFYRGLALARIGRQAEAREIFDGLVALANQRLTSSATDFFAK